MIWGKDACDSCVKYYVVLLNCHFLLHKQNINIDYAFEPPYNASGLTRTYKNFFRDEPDLWNIISYVNSCLGNIPVHFHIFRIYSPKEKVTGKWDITLRQNENCKSNCTRFSNLRRLRTKDPPHLVKLRLLVQHKYTRWFQTAYFQNFSAISHYEYPRGNHRKRLEQKRNLSSAYGFRNFWLDYYANGFFTVSDANCLKGRRQGAWDKGRDLEKREGEVPLSCRLIVCLPAVASLLFTPALGILVDFCRFISPLQSLMQVWSTLCVIEENIV